MSTLKLVNLQHQSSNTPALVLDANNLVTVTGNLNVSNSLVVTGNTIFSGSVNFNTDIVPTSSFKRNRIINGNMAVDQRNAGAQITAANLTTTSYMVDRWSYASSQAAKFTAQQNAGAVTAAAGFPNYLGMTVATVVTVGASDFFTILQNIEGFNFADLGFGTYNAKTVTLSFIVYSSLTGTFGGSLRNSASTRSYPFTYSISTANTWTTISVTIAGDTSGTWVGSTNGIGIQVLFGLGVGTTYSGTAGAWAATNYISATGATSVVGTSGATFYLTGVQLEVGTKATPYEYQIYSEQLVQCQRYYEVASFGGQQDFMGWGSGVSYFFGGQPFKVTKRATPVVTFSSTTYYNNGGSTIAYTPNVYGYTVDGFYVGNNAATNAVVPKTASGTWYATAEL